ncbi:hypothetical protein [Buttiauxella brennerae]|uniref:hypothetical protein n=1 Tax=Buttiauxella brennerae TaxID=82988 RepID=UPI00286F04A2|nr:hypothetical protein [Buttiauxella brennerae]
MPEAVKAVLYGWGEKVIQIIPYMTLLSGMVIWTYLNSLGRVDMFSDALSFNSGLVTILVSTIVFAVIISIILTIPSSMLIFMRLAYENNSKAECVLTKLPAACMLLSISFLFMVFIPFIPEVEVVTHGYRLDTALIFTIVLVLSFLFVFLTLMRNYECDKKYGMVKNTVVFIFQAVFNTLIVFISTLSISVPISLLMQSSKGENTFAICIALLFMIVFTVLALFPASVYFVSFDNKKGISNITSKIHQLSLSVFIVILFMFFVFPNLSTMFIYSSLNAIGVVSKSPHFYLVSGEKYKPAMFFKGSWDTRTPPDVGDNFYIKGVNVFSIDDKNLICPEEIVKIKNNIDKRDYASFIPLVDKKSVTRLKELAKDCVILLDDDIHQWDTLFDNNGGIKK